MADQDASCKLKVSDSNMRVYANYTPSSVDGEDLTVDDVIRQLESLNVNTGVKHDIIERTHFVEVF